MNPYQPTVRATKTPTFSWPSIAGAATYRFYLQQDGRSPTPNIALTPSQVNDNGTSCSYTPVAPTFSIPLVSGHYATWFIEAYGPGGNLLFSPGMLYFWVANTMVGNTDYNADAIDTFDPKGCLFYSVSDFIGQSRRVVDVVLSYTNNVPDRSSFNYYLFPENQYVTLDVSDIVPTGLVPRAARLSMELITSGSAPAGGYYYDLIGFDFRRYGATALNIPVSPLRYSVNARTPVEVTVLIGQDQYGNSKLDFSWSHVANGIDVAAVDGSTITGRALNGSIIGFYA